MMAAIRDLRFGILQLRSRPGVSVTAVASLALGIGLTTAIFSVVNAVLLRTTPVSDPEGLVEVYSSWRTDVPEFATSYPDFLALRQGVDAFKGVAAHSFVRAILASTDRPQLVVGETVTENYFEVLGLGMAVGRSFIPQENTAPGAAPVAVISHALWQRLLGGRQDAAGQTINLSGRAYTVVGVAPRDFRGIVPGVPVDFWVPVMMVDHLEFAGMQASVDGDPGHTRVERRGTRWLFVKARLAPGRTIEQARAQADLVFAGLRDAYPTLNEGVHPRLLPAASIRFHPMLDGYVRAAGGGLLVAVGLVLMVACANVASILAAQGAARRRELAIRASLGASPSRIVRQLLNESLVLAFAGGAFGILLALAATRVMTGLGTDVFPFPIDFRIMVDGRVLAFALAVSLTTTVVTATIPAIPASRVDLVTVLKGLAERGSRAVWWRPTLRDSLVVGQLALSLVLLVAGSLLVRGLLAARHTDLGFDPAHLTSLSFDLQMNGYDEDRAETLRASALATVRALPGVAGASLTSRLPLAPDIHVVGLTVPGHHAPTDDPSLVDAVVVGTDYFTTVGVPILAGRPFNDDDLRRGRRVAIVNEALARRYWPDGSALGRSLHVGGFEQPALEIVGIARNHKVRSVAEAPLPYLHRPMPRSLAVGLVIRTAGAPSAALPMLRQALWQLEPNIVFTEDVPAMQLAAATMAPTTIGAAVLGGLGALAALLAGVGLYGLVAYSVSLRTREIGVRVALGAEWRQVVGLILWQGGRLAVVGVAIGGAAALGVGQLLAGLLYGVSPRDPAAFVSAAGLLLLVILAANLVPAVAAARIDPLQALQRD